VKALPIDLTQGPEVAPPEVFQLRRWLAHFLPWRRNSAGSKNNGILGRHQLSCSLECNNLPLIAFAENGIVFDLHSIAASGTLSYLRLVLDSLCLITLNDEAEITKNEALVTMDATAGSSPPLPALRLLSLGMQLSCF
jgi:hypothetical protein